MRGQVVRISRDGSPEEPPKHTLQKWNPCRLSTSWPTNVYANIHIYIYMKLKQPVFHKMLDKDVYV